METAICYAERDNSFTITMKKNGTTLTAVEMGVITKFEIIYNGAYYDSVGDPTGFDVTDAAGTVKVMPYALGLTTSSDKVELIVYDAVDNTHGLVWDQFKLVMKGDAPAEV